MEKLNSIEGLLEKIHKNIAKNPNRKYSRAYLTKQSEVTRQHLNSYNAIAAELQQNKDATPRQELQDSIERVKKVRDNIYALIKSKEEEAKTDEEEYSSAASDQGDTEQEDIAKVESIKEDHKHVNKKMAAIAFKDVEDALEKFDGTANITKWVKDFEDVAKTCQWNNIQKYLFMRRLLRKAAKLAVEATDEIATYDALKEFLELEFAKEVRSVDIHKELREKKKVTDETMLEYAYKMKRIASRGGVDNKSLIEYIVAGLSGSASNKFTLLEADNFDELKIKLKIYEQLQSQSKDQRKPDGAENSKQKRCFKCGEAGHMANNCSKEVKCFKCNEFGHIAPKCKKSYGDTSEDKQKKVKCYKCGHFGHYASNCTKKEEKEVKVGCIRGVSAMYVESKINNVQCSALIDTGSDYNLVREDIYKRLQVNLEQSTKNFVGLGMKGTVSIGKFEAEVLIQDNVFEATIYVLPTSSMTAEFIVGHDLLRNAEVVIRENRVTIKKADWKETQDLDGETDVMKIDCVDSNELEVPQEYREKIENLIKHYEPRKNVETTVETKIVLVSEDPIMSRPRRLAPKERKVLDEQIEQWLKDKVIRPSVSEFSSAVVIVPKKDNAYRVCIDYRQLNKRIIRDCFPMPLIEDLIDELSGAIVFSTLDLKNGFFHVPVAEASQKYTSFVTPSGQYEFLKTPFGLSVSPANFLRFVSITFADLLRQKIIKIYMDDIIIPGTCMEDAFNKLKITIGVAAEKGIDINWKKCNFLKNEVDFLGYRISNGCIRPSAQKIQAVQRFPEPTMKKHIQSFLGLTGYFRKFVRDYAKTARPLSDILKENSEFTFGFEQREAFLKLKKTLTSEPVLKIFDRDAETEVHTDASQEGYGAVMLQRSKDGKDFHPVYYMSCKTSDVEKRYHSYHLEALAVIKAIEKFRVYLLGKKFKLVTDCSAFEKTLKTTKELPAKVARWVMFLEEFDYTVEHRAGDKLKHVDALSRHPIMVIEDNLTALIKENQKKDERLNVIRQLLAKEPYKDYIMESDILMKFNGQKNVIALPAAMHTETIRKMHENGHFGAKKVTEAIMDKYYIPKLQEKIEKHISCCVPCVLAERKRGKKEGELMPIPKGDTPMDTYHIDHLGPMTNTSKMYKYLFVIIDGFSKFAWIYPTKTTNAKEVLDKLIVQQKSFGNPRRIVTDKGAAYTSNDFEQYCRDEGIEHVTITTGIPRGNGQVERLHQVIISVLAKLAINDPDKWYRHVNSVQRCINNTYQRSVATTPFEVMFGVKMNHCDDADIIALIEEEAVQIFDEARDDMRQAAKRAIQRMQEENRRNHNRRCKPAKQYKVNDLVFIKRTQFGTGLKIKKKFLGPYKISQVNGKNRYEVIRVGESEGPRITSTSADFMKPYQADGEEEQ